MLTYQKVIGANTDLLSIQAFFFPKVLIEDETRPVIAAIISGEGDDVFTKIRQSGFSVEEVFYEDESIETSKRLEKVFLHLKKELSKVENLSLLVAAVEGKVLYLKSLGHHKLLLYRNQKVLEVTENSRDEQLVSGFLKSDDKLILMSGGTETGADFDIQKFFNLSLESFEDEIGGFFHSDKPFGVIRIDNKNIYAREEIEISAKDPLVSQDKPRISLPKLPKVSLNSLIKKKFFIGGVVLGLLGVLLVGFLSFRLMTAASVKNAEIKEYLTDASRDYQKASEIKDSNPEEASSSLSNALTSIKRIYQIDPENNDAKLLEKEIKEKSGEILKIYQITDPSLLLSLDLVKKEFNPKKFSESVGKVLLLDDKQKSLVLINLATKNNQILAGQFQLGQAELASLNGDLAFVYSLDKGVLSIDILSKKITTVAPVDSEWGKIDGLFAFGSNVYLLDSLKNQIWKYTPTKSGYSDKLTYLKDGQKVDFSGSKGLFIDFSVWVLKSGPEILRFTGGVEDSYSIGGLDQPIGELQTIFVSEEEDKTYLLDTDNSRVVVTKKNGPYLAQYVGDIFKTASDILINDEAKKMFILEGGKIYQADLH